MKHIFKKSGPPDFTPRAAGHHYIDILNETHYLSVGTSSSNDWKLVTPTIATLNGLDGPAITLAIGTSGTAPNIIDNDVDTITVNIPNASSGGVTAGLISKAKYDQFDSKTYPVQNVLRVIKNATLGSQDFSSINDAITSITGMSASNPFLILVGPGIFEESTITMAPGLTIWGSGEKVTFIETTDPNEHAFILAAGSMISNLTIQGATGIGSSACYFQPSSFNFDSVVLRNIQFGNNYTFLRYEATLGGYFGFVDVVNVSVTSDSAPTVAFYVNANNSTPGGVSVDGFRAQLLNPIEDAFLVHGTSQTIIVSNSLIVSATLTGNCFRAYDGSLLNIRNAWILSFDVGIRAENNGAGSSIQAEAVISACSTYDFLISHPATIGSIQGRADGSKILINTDSEIKLSYLDSTGPSPGQTVLGDLFQGTRHDQLVSISRLTRETSTMGAIAELENFISVASGLTITVAAGSGFLADPIDVHVHQINWAQDDLVLSANTIYYIYVDVNSAIVAATSLPSLKTVILLGRVATNASGIRYIESSDMIMSHYSNQVEQFLRSALGPVFESGALITESLSNARRLDATAGNYYYGASEFEVNGGSEIVWERLYRNGSGGFTSTTSQNTVSNSQYDNGSGTLASIPSGKYIKSHLYFVSSNGVDTWFLIMSQNVFDTSAEAIDAPLPIIPTFISNSVVRIAGIVTQEGSSPITEIIDIRPRIGFSAPAGTAVTDHGDLGGLTDDDHLQYLPLSGSRAMTGPLDLGGQAITNVGNVDGVDVSAHASRHLPNGADPLATGVAFSVGAANATGTANALARQDHIHRGVHALKANSGGTNRFGDLVFLGTTANVSITDDGAGNFTWDLISTAVTPAAYGSASQVPSFTVDAKGRLTAAANVTITPAAIGAQSVDSDLTAIAGLTTNGLIARTSTGAISTRTITAGTGISLSNGDGVSGDPTVTLANTAVTPGSYGSSALIPVITIDQQGRVTAASTAVPAIAATRTASTTLITTTSASYVVMTGMTLTPAAGTYLVQARAIVTATSNNRTINISIFSGGSQQTDSEVSTFIRTGSGFLSNTDIQTLSTEALVTVNGSQAIDIRWLTSGGTAQAQGYGLVLIKAQ